MEYLLENGKRISFTVKDFISRGGQAHLYVKGDVVFKVYDNAACMIPVEKIRELQSLSLGNICRPTGIVFTPDFKPAGVTMKLIKDAVPLARLYTTSSDLQPV